MSYARVVLSIFLVLIALGFIYLLKIYAPSISASAQFLLVTGSSSSLIIGFALITPPLYAFLQHWFKGTKPSVITTEEKIGRKPVIALDTNVLINAFLYKHPEYVKESKPLYLRDDFDVIELVKSGEIIGFTPYSCVKEARNVLANKYRMNRTTIGKFFEEITEAGIKFSLKRYSPFKQEQIDALSRNFVHRKDEHLAREALDKYCDAIVTGDRRFVKIPSLVRYIPVLYTQDFLDAIKHGVHTKEELSKESYKKIYS